MNCTDPRAFLFDLHDVWCPPGLALTQFRLQARWNSTQMRFVYTCQAPVAIRGAADAPFSTAEVPVRDFFDFSLLDPSVSVKCPAWAPALQRWFITRPVRARSTSAYSQINYTCAFVTPGSRHALSCVERFTDMTDTCHLTEWRSDVCNAYLDRHNVQCGC